MIDTICGSEIVMNEENFKSSFLNFDYAWNDLQFSKL